MSITKEEIFKEKMDALAISIVNKSGASGKKNLDELKALVDDELVKQIEEFDGTVEVVETTITFTIDSIEYQAEEDMTWADWVDSEYNTGGFYVSGSMIYKDNAHYISKVNADDKITPNNNYKLLTGGGNAD
jgi:hypothetical protein